MIALERAALIDCGMYALSNNLKDAWQQLLSPLPQFLANTRLYDTKLPAIISFQCGGKVFSAPELLVAQTCGYPWLKKWQPTHQLITVAEYALEGTKGHQYCSWIITNKKNKRRSLEDYRDGIAAINGFDSNSGMNVLRHAIAALSRESRFFGEIKVSGSHLKSIELVARGEADIAAIDSVSFHYFKQLIPQHIADVAIIGQTEYTTGLPFIASNKLDLDKASIIEAMNKCLANLSPKNYAALGIQQFIAVNSADYEKTAKLEHDAIEANYPVLR